MSRKVTSSGEDEKVHEGEINLSRKVESGHV
jgi:hypothetical protein